MKPSKQLCAVGCIAFAGLIVLVAKDARAAAAASDSACNYSVAIANGANFGTGFGNWAVTSAGGGSNYFATSTFQNVGNPGVDLVCNGKSWGLWANGGTPNSQYVFDDRPFTAGSTPNATLQSNQTFQIYYSNGGVDGSGGTCGFALLDTNNKTNFIFKFTQGGAYTHNGNNTAASGFTMVGQKIAFTLTSTNTYRLVISIPTNGTSSVNTYTGSFLTGGQAITKVRLFNNGAGNGNQYNQNYANLDWFNNMTITCSNLTVSVTPATAAACAGGNANFYAAPSIGASVPVYQWMKGSTPVADGGTISGANTTNLVLTGVSAGDDNSTWYCIVTNACGTYATNTVASTLSVPSNVSISTQPGDTTVCSGSGFSFTVAASGATSYQWYKGTSPSGTSINNGGTISGATSATLVYSSSAGGDAANYYVVASGCGSPATSSGVSLTLSSAQSISGQPTNFTACATGNAVFGVTGSGSPLNYAWRKVGAGWGSGNGWAFTPGGSGGFFVSSSAGNGGGGSPTIDTSSKAWGMFNSSGATTEAIRSFPAALAVGQQFQIDMDNGFVPSGKSVGFSLRNSTGNIVWEFYFTGGGSYFFNDSGNTNITTLSYAETGLRIILTLTSATTYSATVSNLSSAAKFGPYNGTLKNPAGGQIPAQVRLFNANNQSGNQYDLYFNKMIVAGVADDNAAAYSTSGANAGWQVAASNFNGGQAPLANGGTVSGSTSASLTLTGVATGDSGSAFDVVLTNACGYVQSTTGGAALTVNAAPTVQTMTGTTPVCSSVGSTIGLGSSQSGVTYQLYTNTTFAVGSPVSGTGSAISFGAKTGAGTYTVVATVTAGGCTANMTGSVVINANPTITTSSPLPSGTANVAYSQSLASSGGSGSGYTYTKTAGTLPSGITLSSGGLLSGTSSTPGLYNFTVQVSDSNGCTGSKVFDLTIACNVTITISPTTVPTPTVGAAYSQQLTASGGSGGYVFTITTGSLPAGLSMNSSGLITGTPTSSSTANFTVTATDSNGCPGSQAYTVTPACPTITLSPNGASTNLTAGTVGTAYSQNITASGGNNSFTFAKTAGTLPTGVTLSSGGVLSGTPTASGTYSFTVTATDTSGCTGSLAYQVTMNCPTITVGPATMPNALTNTTYASQTMTSSGGAAAYTYAVSAGSLPSGLALSSGIVSGTPTTAGTYVFTIRSTDANGCQGSNSYTVVIGTVPAISSSPTNLTVCAASTANFTVAANGTAPLSYSWRKRGTGWGSGWTFNAGGGGFFIGNSSTNGFYDGHPTGDINVNSKSWGLFNNNGASVTEAIRTFPAALNVGQQFQIDMDNGYVSTSSSVGLSLRNASGNIVWEFYFTGGGAFYIINDNATPHNTTAPYADYGTRLIFTLTDSTHYSVKVMQPAATGALFTGTFTGQLLAPVGGSVPAQVRLFDANGNAGPDSHYDLFFNNIIVNGVSDDNASNYSSWGGAGLDFGQKPLTDGGTISGSSGTTLSVGGNGGLTAGDSSSSFDAVVTNIYGYATSSAATLTVDAPPTTASISSSPLDVCGLTSGSLGGNAPSVGSGSWSKVSGPGNVNFGAGTSGSSTATATLYGTYVLRWTISNGSCTSSSADVTVNYYQAPTTATVGGTQNICGSLVSGSLGGNTPSVGSGAWSKVSGPGNVNFSAGTSGSSTATADAYGTYVLRWTISNGTCTPSTADVTVNYYQTPTTATVGGTQNICGSLVSGSLGGNTPSVGAGAWSKVSGPGNVSFSAGSSGSSTATADAYGTYVLRWTISNGTCTPSSADVTVNYSMPPGVTNPSNATKCEGESVTFTVTGSGTGPLHYQWRKGGTTPVGTDSPSYTINSVVPGDSGNYDCVVSGVCSPNATSSAATLTVTAGCVPTSWLAHYGLSGSQPTDMGANGMTLLQSWLAGVDPTNPSTKLVLPGITVTPLGAVTITWNSKQDGQTPQRLYDVHYHTGPFSNGVSWTRGLSNEVPQGDISQAEDNVSAANITQRFYRVTIAGHTNDVATPEIAGVHALRLVEGANYVSMSMLPGTNTLLSVLGTNQLPQGSSESTATTVDIWNQNSQVLGATYWLATGNAGWIHHGDSAPSNGVLLDPYKGLVITIRAGQGAQILRIVGFVPTSNQVQVVQGTNGYTVASSTYPTPIALNAAGGGDGSGLVASGFLGGISLSRSDNLLFFNPATQLFDVRIWYATGDNKWHNADASITTRKLQPGEAFLIQRSTFTGHAGNFTWTNTVPYTTVPQLQGP